MELAVGDAFGRYRIVAPIGVGGNAHVYRAHDGVLDRSVALKILRPDRETDEDAVARFSREARLAARISHPNAIRVYDVGEISALPFIAMEWVDGHSLAQIVRRDDVSRERLVGMLLGAARGLAAAHEVKLVHRDVKPSNVMVARDDTAKIVDFGLARRHSTSMNQRRLTGTGWILGTPQFMAPEQMMTADVDARADQFSWALTAFVVLAHGVNPRGPLEPGSESIPRLDTYVDVAPAVADVLERALAVRPADRFPSMREVIDAFERANQPRPIAPRRVLYCPGCASALDADRSCLRCGYTGGPGLSQVPNPPTQVIDRDTLRFDRRRYECPIAPITTAAFDPTNRHILAIGARGLARWHSGAWHVDDGTLRGFSPDRIHCMTRLEDGAHLLGGDGALVIVLDPSGGGRRCMVGHERAAQAVLVAVEPAGRTLVGSAGGGSGFVVRAHANGATTAMSAPRLLTGVARGSNGTTFACATRYGIFEVTDDDVVRLLAPEGLDLSVMIAAGSAVFAAGPAGSACRIDGATGQVTREPAATRAAIEYLATHGSSLWGMTTAGELLLREAGVPRWRLLTTVGGEHFRCVAIHADERGVIALGSDGSLFAQTQS